LLPSTRSGTWWQGSRAVGMNIPRTFLPPTRTPPTAVATAARIPHYAGFAVPLPTTRCHRIRCWKVSSSGFDFAAGRLHGTPTHTAPRCSTLAPHTTPTPLTPLTAPHPTPSGQGLVPSSHCPLPDLPAPLGRTDGRQAWDRAPALACLPCLQFCTLPTPPPPHTAGGWWEAGMGGSIRHIIAYKFTTHCFYGRFPGIILTRT